ncbi:MAG: DUF305 domain-containing protein [Mycobacteriaceae bacterium]|nr:DUF305 domain-containing protein [Mycobacteriaceae bacterium]
MSFTATRVCAVVAAALTAATLSSCGTSPRSGDAAPSAVHNSDDVTFAQRMIPHHQQAVDMAAMVPSHTTNPTLRVVAVHISTDQHAEIGMLTDLLTRWGAPVSAPGSMSMEGMVDDATMNRLPSLSGAQFDTVWITAMIGHHQGAVTMAQAELAHGQNPDAQKMARLIITAQQREISYMTDLISTPQ